MVAVMTRGDEQPASPREHSEQRFTEYIQPHIPLLYGAAYTLTRSSSDAEDLVQDTLLRAYRAIDRFDGAYPKAWLLTILRNTNINRAQKKTPFLFDDPDHPSAELVDHVTPEDLVVEPIFDAAVQRALDDLPAVFRSVVDLVDVTGLTYAEAADALGIPVGTVMSRLHRGRRRIRQRLGPNAHARRRGNR
jgi:RNA polymerase sigma-70 factor (ECF subfamily)